jgi:hypothetical protein
VLADDPEVRVRYALVLNPSVPESVLVRLAEAPDAGFWDEVIPLDPIYSSIHELLRERHGSSRAVKQALDGG